MGICLFVCLFVLTEGLGLKKGWETKCSQGLVIQCAEKDNNEMNKEMNKNIPGSNKAES